MFASALPRKCRPSEICVGMRKNVKNIPDIINHNLKKHYQNLISFSQNIFDTTGYWMTVQVFTSPNVCSCTTLGKQTKQIMCWNKWKNFNKFHLSRSLGPNSQSITKVDRHKAVMTFKNIYEFKKWLMKFVLVWSKTLSIQLSMNAESVSMPVFAHWPIVQAILL